MQYATGDVEHQDMTFAAPFATGAVGLLPQNRIAVDELQSVPRTIRAPFVASDIRGNPPAGSRFKQADFYALAVLRPVAAEGENDNPLCTGSLTIGDIRFYR